MNLWEIPCPKGSFRAYRDRGFILSGMVKVYGIGEYGKNPVT